MRTNLNKTNFWNALEEDYPAEVHHFKEWLDRYKMKRDWKDNIQELVKFHDLPFAFQIGVIMLYFKEVESAYTYWNADLLDPDEIKQGVRDIFAQRALTEIMKRKRTEPDLQQLLRDQEEEDKED